MNLHALVLCEGKEDRLVFEKIASLAGLQGLKFEDYGGKDNLAAFLKSLQSRPDFTRKEFKILAVTRDADDSYPDAWRSVCGALKANFDAELSAPGEMIDVVDRAYPMDPSMGLIAWVLPSPEQSGMLETLCLESVSDQPAYACLTRYFECLSENMNVESFHPKAKFHAWVVSQTDFKDKDYKIEKAVKEDRFNWHHSAFDPLREFLKKLVG